MSARRFRPSLIPLAATLVVSSVCMTAGFWQLSRAEYKESLTRTLEERKARGTLALTQVLEQDDTGNQPVRVSGRFDNQYTVLLDNRMHDRIAGYHVLTLFYPDRGPAVLINRGWLPRGSDRAILPEIPDITDPVQLTGRTYLYSPDTLVLREDNLSNPEWPLRVQHVDMSALSKTIGVELAPFEIRVAPGLPLEQEDDFVRVWHDPVMGPERHRAYAVQWFALAGTVVIFFLTASFRRLNPDNNQLDA